jgi:phage tail-like protein
MNSLLPQKSMHIQTTQHSRREFLTRTALLTGGILTFGWPFINKLSGLALAEQSQQDMNSGERVRFLLELNGSIAGPLHTIRGGGVSREVLTYKTPDFIRKKLGNLKYEDIVLTCGTNLSFPFYQWLADTINTPLSRKNGAIVVVNPTGQIIERREFHGALVKEIAFPACDTTSHDLDYLKLTLAMERITSQVSNSRRSIPPLQAHHSGWSPSEFRLRIQGLEQACSSIQRIEPLVLKQDIVTHKIIDKNGHSSSSLVPGRKNTGNLIITLPYPSAGPFAEWFSSFVLQGQGDGNRKQGVLEFLTPNSQSVFTAIALDNLGIFRMAPVIASGTSQVKIEMFCETVQLTQFPGGGSSPDQQRMPRSRQRKFRKPTTRKQLSPIQQKK